MSGRTDHSEWDELVAGHALHALDASDEDRLTTHLEGCEDCRHELDAHALTASHLASLADDADTAPPAWSSIRAGILSATKPASDETAGSAEPAVLDELALRRERRRPQPWILAAAAVVMVLAGGTVAGWQVLGANGSGNNLPASLIGCGSTHGCLEIDLRSSDGVNRAAVIVTHGAAEVQPVALSAPASGRTFVLWQLPHGGAPIPLGEFDSTTLTSASHRLAVSMAQTTAFAVSSEDSDTPPTTPTDVLALGGATA